MRISLQAGLATLLLGVIHACAADEAPELIIKLNSSAPPYQVSRVKPEPKVSKFVSVGDEFAFGRGVVRFKVEKFEKKTVPDPALRERDVSEMTLIDLTTKQRFKLVRVVEYRVTGG